jgi:hypothetical protein
MKNILTGWIDHLNFEDRETIRSTRVICVTCSTIAKYIYSSLTWFNWCSWYTMVHADGSVLQTFEYLKQNGIDGLKSIWPMPTPIAWKIIACFGAFEALLQLALPGKRFEGPVSPAGNVPVYKVSIICLLEVLLVVASF